MGSATSKVVKSYPKTVRRPEWAGSRKGDIPSAAPSQKASEIKTKEIDQDAHDPQFLSNLTKMGQVRVDHEHVQPVKPSQMPNKVVQSRVRLEESAPTGISAQTLTILLTEAKSANASQLDSLVKKHGLDLGTFKNLSKHINTPSIDPASVTNTKDKDGHETQTATALWV